MGNVTLRSGNSKLTNTILLSAHLWGFLLMISASAAAAPCTLNAASPSVTICTPTNGTTVSSPVTVSAGTTDNAHPVTAMIVYLDNTAVFKVSANQLSTSLSMSAGKHNITVNAWDSSGAVFKSTSMITVSGTGQAPVSVSVSPSSATIAPGASQQFSATVLNTTNTAVTWAVDGVVGGNATVGTVSMAGLYKAPPTNGTHTIGATSAADSTKSDSAIVTVTGSGSSGACSPAAAPSVTICSPASGATVSSPVLISATGASSTPITKLLVYIDSVLKFQTTTSSSVNTSLAVADGSHNLTVQFFNGSWVAKNEKFTVQGSSPISVNISPTSAILPLNGSQQFTASVTGTSTTVVNWSVDSIPGGNTTVGTITTLGLYTAPGTSGTHTIQATSQASSAASASATVTVGSSTITGDITVNFNGRSGGFTIPAGLFGSQLGALSSLPAMEELADAGIGGTRLYANVQSVFGSKNPNWSYIDPTLDKLQTAGLKAILMIAYTPTWLQPTPNPCSEIPASSNAHPYNSDPTDNAAYASIAAQYVAHIDQKYPGLVQYYEIWNEADEINQFCGLHSGDPKQAQLRLNEYKAIYIAAATAMKAQAAKDGTSIKVGGPALGNYYGSNYWISQLVQSANSGAKLVDFVSYHQYPAGADVSHTMTFDGAGGTVSLYARTMSPTTGLAAIYKSIAGAAGSNIPVLLDEFNEDWDFYNDCCKNKPKYSALWNTLVFATIMNTAYSGVPPLQHLSYYSASNQPFCLLGYTGDGLYGCGSTSPLPYPQFRAFELLASHNFLDLQAQGGHLALSASTTSSLSSAGLVVTAFYTPGSDAVVLVNPTGTAVTNKVLAIGNHGFASPTATQYLLNGTTYSATYPTAGTALSLTPNGANVTATVTIPPYSVLAIKVE